MSGNLCTKPAKSKTSIYRGVSKCSNSNSYVAQIKQDGHTTYLGSFDDEEQAAKRYDMAVKILKTKNPNYEALYNFGDPGDLAEVDTSKPLPEIFHELKFHAPLDDRRRRYKGLTYYTSRGTWKASIRHKKRTYFFGSSKSFDTATQMLLKGLNELAAKESDSQFLRKLQTRIKRLKETMRKELLLPDTSSTSTAPPQIVPTSLEYEITSATVLQRSSSIERPNSLTSQEAEMMMHFLCSTEESYINSTLPERDISNNHRNSTPILFLNSVKDNQSKTPEQLNICADDVLGLEDTEDFFSMLIADISDPMATQQPNMTRNQVLTPVALTPPEKFPSNTSREETESHGHRQMQFLNIFNVPWIHAASGNNILLYDIYKRDVFFYALLTDQNEVVCFFKIKNEVQGDTYIPLIVHAEHEEIAKLEILSLIMRHSEIQQDFRNTSNNTKLQSLVIDSKFTVPYNNIKYKKVIFCNKYDIEIQDIAIRLQETHATKIGTAPTRKSSSSLSTL